MAGPALYLAAAATLAAAVAAAAARRDEEAIAAAGAAMAANAATMIAAGYGVAGAVQLGLAAGMMLVAGFLAPGLPGRRLGGSGAAGFVAAVLVSLAVLAAWLGAGCRAGLGGGGGAVWAAYAAVPLLAGLAALRVLRRVYKEQRR